MWKKYCLYSLLGIFILTMFAACSGGEKDPFTLVTLRQATQGNVVSKGFRYRFQSPNIVQVHDHLGLIREGNLIEFISGRSLESRLAGLTEDFELCVIKEYSPFVHFRVEKIYTATDTVFIPQAGAISYPQVHKADEFNAEGYAEFSVDGFPYNKTAFLRSQVDKKFYVTCQVGMEEEEGEKFFVLTGEDSKLRVAEPTDGISLMLKVLMKGNYPFEGGFTFSEAEESFPYRKSTRIVGSVEVDFVKYGMTVVSS